MLFFFLKIGVIKVFVLASAAYHTATDFQILF